MYADIVIDITHDALDRPFTYQVPNVLAEQLRCGMWVWVPFGRGNQNRKGFVLRLHSTPPSGAYQIKQIAGIVEGEQSADDVRISLAVWMYQEYGGTLIQALKTVIPVRKSVRQQETRQICLTEDETALAAYLELAEKKNWKGRLRLLKALQKQSPLDASFAREQLGIHSDILNALQEQGLIRVETNSAYRRVIPANTEISQAHMLTSQQQTAVRQLTELYRAGVGTPALLHGVTGSGKTEVYMHLIQTVIDDGKQAIVLIPEISLTYQVVMNFYSRFQDRVSMINSRLSDGERYDQMERARRGDISVMIGPRSALFTPFQRLGLIIIDEEQESAYNSEQIPRYHARETAAELARLTGAMLLLGSATPSLESYYRAQKGEYRLYQMTKRAAAGSVLPQVSVVDMRMELAAGNRSIFSRELREKMQDCLNRRQQMMLFINRRGFSRVVSCRTCGKAIGCPHCDVPLTEHVGEKLMCHYCGYTMRMPEHCPTCKSPYLAGFGLGTQRVEMMLQNQFPQARILRMDMDTTARKDGHRQILEDFRNKKADILVGTQMIVKGHDFPAVTLVGILAADMSLYSPDFRNSERTFQLLTQAAGRAGRGELPGTVVIQTYDPGHYSIQTAAAQNYEDFYQQEIIFRRRMAYPPEGYMCEIMVSAAESEVASNWIQQVVLLINSKNYDIIKIIGPSDAPIARVKDMYRKHLYMTAFEHESYRQAIQQLEDLVVRAAASKVYITITAL